MDFDYSDLFIAAMAGAVVFRTAEWAFVRWMERRRHLPLFRDVYDHCQDCELPITHEQFEAVENRAFVQDIIDQYPEAL